MRNKSLLIILFFIISSIAWKTESGIWKSKHYKKFILYYSNADETYVKEYVKMIGAGIKSVESFFDASFQAKFDVYIHPTRSSLDSQWQKDWQMPDFKSECWMVASGIASKLDVISPKSWDKEACEHSYSDKLKTQQVITHELFHVYHGQLNSSPDFSNVDNIDWFVEGLATYASGQLDSVRIKEVKNAIINKQVPNSIDKFWTGNLKYALSGSMVMYIDKKYGRKKLGELLKYNKKTEILHALSISEDDLLAGWDKYLETYNSNQ
jgi:hypothetical protein